MQKKNKKFKTFLIYFFREIVGFPIACEGDVDGALGCLIGKLLGLGTVYLSDWLEHDQSTITLWHGGMAPIQVREKLFSTMKICGEKLILNVNPQCD